MALYEAEEVRHDGKHSGGGCWWSDSGSPRPRRASPDQSGWTSRRPTSLETPAPVASLPKKLLDGSVDPRAFGVQDYTITVLSGTQFRSSRCYFTDPATLSDTCYCDNCPEADHTYTTLDVPAGAIIDFIGVNNQTNIEGSLGMTLHFRDHLGGSAQLVALTFPAHEGFVTDFGGPLGILVPDHKDRAFILDVERAAADGAQTNLGYVEVWWRRTVSDPPATPSFGDVPSVSPLLPVHRGAREVGYHGWLRLRRELLPRRAADARPDGGLPVEGARPALAELRPVAAR